MKRFKLIAVLVLAMFFALSIAGCSQDLSTYGNLKVKVIDSDSVNVYYSFAKVPKAVDNGQVYLNDELVGSGSGSGVKRFDNIEPNSVFKLTTATDTLATVISHTK
jgi:hypothetical protein